MHKMIEDIRGVLDMIIAHPWALIPLALFLLIKFLSAYKKAGYRRFIRRLADERLAKIRALDPKEDIRQIFGLMRSVNHFAFEEMILNALQERGLKIKRNVRYTGDGGLDGQFWIGKERILIQAKRYKNHIRRDHVEEFHKLCAKHKCRGIFVHTGRTGKASNAEVKIGRNIQMISGQRVVDLFTHKPVTIFEEITKPKT